MACNTAIIRATFSKLRLAYRDLGEVVRASSDYVTAVTKAARYWAIANGVYSGTDPDTESVLGAAVIEAQAAGNAADNATVHPTSDLTGYGISYATVKDYYSASDETSDSDYVPWGASDCLLTARLLPRTTLLANADIMVRLQLARLAMRFAPGFSNSQFINGLEVDAAPVGLKDGAHWPVIRFAVQYYHVLERLGLHQTIVNELQDLATQALVADTDTDDAVLYNNFLTQSGAASITRYLPLGYLGAGNAKELAAVIQEFYGTSINGIRYYRHEITRAHPPTYNAPNADSSPYKC